jgi:predicted nucleic-acid-binding Zn-ribbon protein
MPKRKEKCPKCNGEMEKGYLLGAWSWISDKKQSNPREAKKIFGYACKNCGYVEFYLKKR